MRLRASSPIIADPQPHRHGWRGAGHGAGAVLTPRADCRLGGNEACLRAPLPAFAELRRRQPEIRSSGVLARFAVTKQLLHIADCTEDPSYKRGDSDFVAFVDLCGVRTLLGAPLLKKGELIGMIGLYRQEVRLFTDQQVELVRNFVAQAVIAIENARLVNELRQRTADLSQRTKELTESLEQQTATSEVLQVISSSPGDREPVFATTLEKAVRSHLRRDIWKHLPLERQRVAPHVIPQHAARVCRTP